MTHIRRFRWRFTFSSVSLLLQARAHRSARGVSSLPAFVVGSTSGNCKIGGEGSSFEFFEKESSSRSEKYQNVLACARKHRMGVDSLLKFAKDSLRLEEDILATSPFLLKNRKQEHES